MTASFPNAGPQGAQGASGSQGAAGSAGAQGSQGAAGTAGSPGSQGAQGATGAQGAAGAPGSQGPQGDIGTQGAGGAAGAQGAQGVAGAVGAQGAAGAVGAQGATGSSGPQGATGAQGTQGAQGATGQAALPTVPGAITGVTGIYLASRSIYNLRAEQLTKTRAALAKAFAGSALARITFVGDSVTAGADAQPATQSFPTYVRKLLAALGYTISGTGVVPVTKPTEAVPYDSRISFGGTWTGNNTALSATSPANGTCTFASDIAGTSATIFYLNGGGPWTYTIDGGAPVTVTPGSDFTFKSVTVSGLSNATHTIVVTAGAGGGNVIYLFGFEVVGAAGISISNLGKSGATAGSWIANTPNYVAQLLPQYNGLPVADMVCICLGLNDAHTAVGAATYLANMASLVAAIQAHGSPDVVLMAPFTPAISTDSGTTYQVATATWVSYMQQLFGLADSLNLPLVYLSERGGLWAAAKSNGIMESGHGAHCTPAGYAAMAQGLLDVLQPF